MAVNPTFRDYVLDQLNRVEPVSGKSMFGGMGLYARGLFFALIAMDRLFFKVNDQTRPRYEARGMEAFQPYDSERPMAYFELPPDVLEDLAALRDWMSEAIDVAAAAKRKPKARRS